MGRWREGGVIDLLGRKDFQVQRRGGRVSWGLPSGCQCRCAPGIMVEIGRNHSPRAWFLFFSGQLEADVGFLLTSHPP